MSRLDFFTIFVVALCILAIIFLIVKAAELAKGDHIEVPETTIIADDYEDETDEESLYDEAEIPADEMDSGAVSDRTGGVGEGRIAEDDEATFEAEGMETETPVARQPEVISNDPALGKYLVLAGTFKIRSGAETVAQRLRNAGYSNAKVSIFDRGTYAVVLVDRFSSRSDAKALADKLKGEGIEDAYVEIAGGHTH